MTDCFDVVTVRSNDEGAIVIGMVMRTKTRCTVVFAAGLQCCAIEVPDLLAILGRERDVQRRRFFGSLEQPKRRLALRPHAETVFAFHDDPYPERLERLQKERLACGVVGNAKSKMVEHGNLLLVVGIGDLALVIQIDRAILIRLDAWRCDLYTV
ncbi:MAG: hypothetical protein A2Z93_00760 [Curvibacter sp. GWA2_64_110]|nr:MAG: hypothetical protein A2Z93_00760 [Curvibacter sp. GWA2_64_110]